MGNDIILRLERMSKEYSNGQNGALSVLREINLELERGTTCSLVGPSGSGKTTLLGLCAGLDRPSSGSVELLGQRLEQMSEDELAELRNQSVGFVFQSFQLIPTLTALENVMVPAELRGRRDARHRAEELLDAVGLGGRTRHFPAQLSGGEQQRVALARAYINRPEILIADEPTGNLDEETGQAVEELLFELNRSSGTTLLIATHNLELARKSSRLLRMEGGKVVDEETGRAA